MYDINNPLSVVAAKGSCNTIPTQFAMIGCDSQIFYARLLKKQRTVIALYSDCLSAVTVRPRRVLTLDLKWRRLNFVI